MADQVVSIPAIISKIMVPRICSSGSLRPSISAASSSAVAWVTMPLGLSHRLARLFAAAA
jgi:hypothetical protein